MAETKKFLDQDGVAFLWSKLSMQDYPNNDTLVAVITAIDETKSDIDHTHSEATTSAAGFMSADMVTKLNGIAEGATNVTIDTALNSTSTNPVQNKIVYTAINDIQTSLNGIREATSAEIQALFK